MYRVTCNSCGQPFDALKSPECSCIQPVHSYTCPHCGKCFCDAPSAYQTEFWRNAPAEIWKRRKKRSIQGEDLKQEPETVEGKVVLFADDDPVGRSIARQVVKSLGYAIVVAADGESALQMARQYRPELIITDALMPKRDGREVAKTVKQEMPGTKIVVITSVYKDPRYKHEAYRDFGVDEYLSKPIKPDDLRAVVDRYLG